MSYVFRSLVRLLGVALLASIVEGKAWSGRRPTPDSAAAQITAAMRAYADALVGGPVASKLWQPPLPLMLSCSSQAWSRCEVRKQSAHFWHRWQHRSHRPGCRDGVRRDRGSRKRRISMGALPANCDCAGFRCGAIHRPLRRGMAERKERAMATAPIDGTAISRSNNLSAMNRRRLV